MDEKKLSDYFSFEVLEDGMIAIDITDEGEEFLKTRPEGKDVYLQNLINEALRIAVEDFESKDAIHSETDSD